MNIFLKTKKPSLERNRNGRNLRQWALAEVVLRRRSGLWRKSSSGGSDSASLGFGGTGRNWAVAEVILRQYAVAEANLRQWALMHIFSKIFHTH